MLNVSLLKSYIVRHDRTQENLANAMKLSLSRLNAKINEYNGAEFTQSEIAFVAQRYNLTASDVNAIFFACEVSCKDTTHDRNGGTA